MEDKEELDLTRQIEEKDTLIQDTKLPTSVKDLK